MRLPVECLHEPGKCVCVCGAAAAAANSFMLWFITGLLSVFALGLVSVSSGDASV